jgi:hypothetical protein
VTLALQALAMSLSIWTYPRMSKFFSIFSRKPVAEKPAAVAGLSAQPLVVTQGEPAVSVDKIEHAKYRLNAIRRTIEQSGDTLSRAHLKEFKAETRVHAHTLAVADVITDDHAAFITKEGKGADL